nr:MAG TPA: hypothetical protein [Caudoviricetes sp.]
MNVFRAFASTKTLLYRSHVSASTRRGSSK